MMVAADWNEHALRDLTGNVRREVASTTDPAAATQLDRIAGPLSVTLTQPRESPGSGDGL